MMRMENRATLSQRRWQQEMPGLALLLTVLLTLIPLSAATAAGLHDDSGTQPITDRGVVWQPLATEPTPPVATVPPVSRPATVPLSTTVTATSAMTETSTVTGTTTVTATTVPPTATVVDSPPLNDAFAAWNNRPPVTRQAAYPVRLQIPAIGVDADVEQHGERADGSMATPTDPAHVAWYSAGAIPGENGNMVMAGHLDRVGGAPAVFWELGKLTVGDEVIVQDRHGTRYHYRVTEQASYPYNQAPLDAIFGFDLVSRLNLITCRGNWDHRQQTYSQRLVVYTELVKIVPERSGE
ncbi:MAG: class F sortase [Caldilineaceae bacterium]|nr:class F sortase [Caldilineaceae bacterium]